MEPFGDAPPARFVLNAILIHTCLLVSLGASALIAVVQHMLGVFAWQPYLTCFAGVLFIYNLDHILDARRGNLSDPELSRLWKGPLRNIVFALAVAGGLVAAGLTIFYNPFRAYPPLLLAAGAGVLYGLPLLPWRAEGGWRLARFKEVPGLKAILIAAAVSIAAVGLPLADLAYHRGTILASGTFPGDALGAGDLTGVFIFLFVYAFTNALMFDLRDRETDAASGLRTLPVLIGPRGVRGLLLILNLLCAKVLVMLWLLDFARPHPEWLPALAFSLAYVFALDESTPRTRFALVVDGGLLLPGLLGVLHGLLP